MIKEDAHEVEKMKEVLGEIDKTVDPTVGAGMNMDQLMEKLMAQNNMAATETMQQSTQPAPQPVPAAPSPQMQQARPQPQAAAPHEVKKNHQNKKTGQPRRTAGHTGKRRGQVVGNEKFSVPQRIQILRYSGRSCSIVRLQNRKAAAATAA